MDRRSFLLGAAATMGGLAAGSVSEAGSTLKIVFPYAPGGGGDVLARLIADHLEKKMGISTIVENRTGADGRIGTRDVKQAEPDGKTLLFTPFGTMVLAPSVFKDLQYDPVADFAPVTQAVTFDFGFATGPMTKTKTLAELVAWLKKNPDQGNVAVPGLGTLPHLLPLKFAEAAGVKITAISHRGTVPSLTAVMGGQLPMVCGPLGDLVAQARAGTINLLATSGKKRHPQVAEVPTFIEQGYNISGSAWYAFYVPAKTPAVEIAKLHKEIIDAIRSPAFEERARSLWLNPTGTTPAELATIQREDFELWAPVIKTANLAPS